MFVKGGEHMPFVIMADVLDFSTGQSISVASWDS